MNKEMHDILDDSIVAKNLLDGKGGKVINGILDTISEKTIYSLCYNIDLSHLPSVVRLIERIRLTKYEYPKALQSLIAEGELVFEDLKESEQLRTPDAETG